MEVDLRAQHVAVLGLGLMGGSLALALSGQVARLIGSDPDPRVCSLALQTGIVQECFTDPIEAISQASLVVLAAPVRAILALLGELCGDHLAQGDIAEPSEKVIIDLGSTKAEIAAAMQTLPRRFTPVGGHPICGKEKGGLANADGRLFHGAAFVLVDLPNSTAQARSLAVQMVEAAGARPLWLDAGTHDRWIAATSHLPYLLSNALAYVTPAQAAPLIGPGFRSAARLAPASRRMMLDILITNQPNILESIHSFRQHLEMVELALLQGNYALLQEILDQGAIKAESLMQGE